MHAADLVAPGAAADGHDGHHGRDDGPADGRGDLLGALDAEADVAVGVADADEGLEARALARARLLLDGHDLHDLVLEGRAEEALDDLVLLDGHGEEVDLLEGLDLALVFVVGVFVLFFFLERERERKRERKEERGKQRERGVSDREAAIESRRFSSSLDFFLPHLRAKHARKRCVLPREGCLCPLL